MSKRKTRKQKIIAELRRNAQSDPHTYPAVMSAEKNPVYVFAAATQSAKTAFIGTTDTYIISDLKKSMVVTCVILLAQLILYFSLIKHLITIPELTY